MQRVSSRAVKGAQTRYASRRADLDQFVADRNARVAALQARYDGLLAMRFIDESRVEHGGCGC
jgi:uncharacterized protein YukE